MNSNNEINTIAAQLLKSPEPGSSTDYSLVRLLRSSEPNVFNAWTHVVPALSKYAKSEGKRSILGRDKGEKAYQQMIEKLHLVILGLYADGKLSRGANTHTCLMTLLRSLVVFKEAHPNWEDAYSAGVRVFVDGRERIKPFLEQHQKSIEQDLFNQKQLNRGQ